ncbi:head-tail adaptor protein [Pseudoruegeria sp. SK021]|uniref:head-tail adaptor protein n=1 Tax=Pseudoruegeria sp. SK021 TaxID=1933035 RepID=UPI000A2382FF|nr:head-tail adaptor protein [Pseudoruegeria sp. SK021]OSP54344.1 hypothetical protein BV911_13315 [Pseudoruegeria sp. SK021]
MKTVALTHEFDLEAPQYVPDGAGGFVETWAVIGVMWGALKTSSGRERTVEAAGVSELSQRIVVRGAPVGAPSRPTARQRFRLGQRLFSINAVYEADPEGRYLTCKVTEEETV